MAGRHTRKSNINARLPMIITIIVLIIAAILICIFLILGFGKKNNTTPTQPTTAATTASQSSPDEATQATTREQGFTASETSATEKIIVPTISGEEQGEYFTASFKPYKAIDPDTDLQLSLKEVFGSSYGGGELSFKSDGTFTDTVGLAKANSGAYAVEGDGIVATYSNDKNILMSITQYSGDIPSEIKINYGGFDVYFN